MVNPPKSGKGARPLEKRPDRGTTQRSFVNAVGQTCFTLAPGYQQNILQARTLVGINVFSRRANFDLAPGATVDRCRLYVRYYGRESCSMFKAIGLRHIKVGICGDPNWAVLPSRRRPVVGALVDYAFSFANNIERLHRPGEVTYYAHKRLGKLGV